MYNRAKVIRDRVGEPPATSAFSCDTQACLDYVRAVDDLSRALTDRWINESSLVEAGSPTTGGKVLSPEQRVEFLNDVKVWLDAHRVPFVERRPSLYESCGSTFPGPCRDAVGIVGLHEKQIVTWNKILEGYIGKKTGIDPIPQTGPGGKGSGGGGGGLFNVNIGTTGLLAAVAAIAVLVAVSKKSR